MGGHTSNFLYPAGHVCEKQKEIRAQMLFLLNPLYPREYHLIMSPTPKHLLAPAAGAQWTERLSANRRNVASLLPGQGHVPGRWAGSPAGGVREPTG